MTERERKERVQEIETAISVINRFIKIKYELKRGKPYTDSYDIIRNGVFVKRSTLHDIRNIIIGILMGVGDMLEFLQTEGACGEAENASQKEPHGETGGRRRRGWI